MLKWSVLLLVVRESVEPDAGERNDSLQGPLHRRDRLIQEKKLVEVNSAHYVMKAIFLLFFPFLWIISKTTRLVVNISF